MQKTKCKILKECAASPEWDLNLNPCPPGHVETNVTCPYN